MNRERFLYVLKTYLDHKSTREEADELIKMVRSGTYDELLKNQIDELFDQDEVFSDMPAFRSKEILKEILNKQNGTTKVIPIRSKRVIRWVAAASIVLITMAAYWMLQESDPQPKIAEYEEVQQPGIYKGKQFVRLPDGSSVVLNENSELSYTTEFGVHKREVRLIGEGFFNIRHDAKRPFKVLTGKITTTVLGTVFNVRAYPEQKEVLVTVSSGKVQVGDEKQIYGTLTPNQEITVNTTTYDFVRSDQPVAKAVAWKQTYLIFDDITLEEAANIITKRYKVEVLIKDRDLKKSSFTATFLDGEGLEQVLTVITGTLNASYKMKDGTVSIYAPGQDE